MNKSFKKLYLFAYRLCSNKCFMQSACSLKLTTYSFSYLKTKVSFEDKVDIKY